MLTKYLIYVVAGFMILNQLGIAKTLVDSTFIMIVAAIAVAFALSFGIGGRDFARNMLNILQSKLDFKAAEQELTAQADKKAVKDESTVPPVPGTEETK